MTVTAVPPADPALLSALDNALAERPGEGDLSRRAASLAGAVAVHAAIALAFLILVAKTPPRSPPPEPETLSVELVTRLPSAPASPAAEDAVPDAEPASEALPQQERPAVQHLRVVVPERSPPAVLRSEAETERPSDTAPSAVPGLPPGVRAALANLHYCRSTSMGIRADLARCPPALDRFALAARTETLDARFFIDPEVMVVREPRGLAPMVREVGPADSDQRMSNSSGMRDSIPHSSLDPSFGD